ncbi:hypothetical protein I3843_08G163500 [Carya illinoinensis]|nr:hypothetical protein I3843_08G163500 [Carya illinoinensis]
MTDSSPIIGGALNTEVLLCSTVAWIISAIGSAGSALPAAPSFKAEGVIGAGDLKSNCFWMESFRKGLAKLKWFYLGLHTSKNGHH